MCWSPEASIGIAVAGVAASVYFYKKGEAKILVGVFTYFTLMEILQAYSYFVIDECTNPANIFATYLAYIHVSLQSIASNIIALHFVPVHVRKSIQKPVYIIASLAALASLIRIMPFEWKQYCYEIVYYIPFLNIIYTLPFCGEQACTMSGSWHLAWSMPAGQNIWLDQSYLFGVFMLPLMYGSWKVAIYIALIGPALAIALSETPNEFGAVWCLLSIGIIGIFMFAPIRQRMHVQGFYGLKLIKDPDKQ